MADRCAVIATVADARLLLASGGDFSVAENWQRAVLAYDSSREYVMDMQGSAAAYSVGTMAP